MHDYNDASLWSSPAAEMDVAGVSPKTLKVLSVNVTALDKNRFLAILDLALEQDADAVVLQETRHPVDGCKWANLLARKAKWRIAWSGSSLNKCGAIANGGTAILWRQHLGKSTAIKFLDNQVGRLCGRRFADFSLVCAYGDANKPQPE